MYDCFRPGDIVRAKVISLGDARSYYLSTADNSLGVVHAKSLAGEARGCHCCSGLIVYTCPSHGMFAVQLA